MQELRGSRPRAARIGIPVTVFLLSPASRDGPTHIVQMSTAASHRLSRERKREEKNALRIHGKSCHYHKSILIAVLFIYNPKLSWSLLTALISNMILSSNRPQTINWGIMPHGTELFLQYRDEAKYISSSPIFAAAITLLANKNLSSIRRAIHDAA
ncbi:hypothetical protein TWF788_005311 [Orbilia oligospora]|uniref:Uncharacterized protein n=1 Tax=Orbilia oligospora TaxID=2813651 RepID=A0A7C8P730_ORBOL|nr:hypothetical protein TWF788_005311 [Orbilia oligospora]